MADSQSINRAGMVSILEKELGYADVLAKSDLSEAEEALLSDKTINFAAFDLDLFNGSDLAPLRRMRLNLPDLNVVVLASAINRSQILELLEIGAHGIVPRTLPTFEMIEALQAVMNGAIYVPRQVAFVGEEIAPAKRAVMPGRTQFTGQLTGRQQEVLELLALGKTNKEIGRMLRIADGTVKVHVSAVFRLLGVRNRISAVATLQAYALADAPHDLSVTEHQLRRAKTMTS